MKRTYTAADAMIETLIAHGVTKIFGYPGGAILPFYDALPFYKDKIEHILVRNEQGAAFAAQGWARSTGELGVCVATSGPGGTNLITGIADAYMDSVPILCITGQVPLEMIGKDMFQEVDMTGITLNITKHNYLVEKVEDIVPITTEAIHIALNGRKGPVHIDAPKNIMAKEHPKFYGIPTIPKDIKKSDPTLKAYEPIDNEVMEKMFAMLAKAKKPILLVGHGVKLSKAEDEINEFVSMLGIPTVSTILAKGVVNDDSPNCLGMLGMHGFYHCNMAVNDADLILNIGSRFDDRIVGRYDAFGKNAEIIHVDIDPVELGKVVTADLSIQADAKLFLKQALISPSIKRLEVQEWRKQIADWAIKFPYLRDTRSFTMRSCLSELHKIISKNPDQYLVATDVGQHQMWSSLSLQLKNAYQWLTSGGAGTMGFALPAAMGAAFAHPDKTVLCIAGDGGIQMNIQELGVLKDHNLNVKVLILNNSYLGMVRQWQELFYENNYSAVQISSPDYPKLAEAYGIAGFKMDSQDSLQKLAEILDSKGPAVIECAVENEDNVFPMVPGGKTLGETITENHIN